MAPIWSTSSIRSSRWCSIRDRGQLPLWNPYQFAGQSIAANPQVALAYPPAWLMIPLGVPRGVGWLATAHLFIGAWGMAIFTRSVGASRPGAFVGGAVYGFSALMGAHLGAGHINYLFCQAWLPWCAAAYLRAWSQGDRWLLPALWGAAAFGLCALSGYPPLLYFCGLWLLALWGYAAFRGNDTAHAGAVSRKAQLWAASRPLPVIVIGGALLGAASLLPAAGLALGSTRTQGADIAFSNSYAMPGGALLTLVYPNVFGHPRLPDHGYWGLPFYEELTAYAGILPLLAIFLIRRRAASLLFGAFALVGVVLSLGIDGGLFTVLYYLLPGYNLFRVPPRALYFTVVGFAGAAALLLTDLPRLSPGGARRVLRPALRFFLPALFVIAVAGCGLLMAYFTLTYRADGANDWRAFYAGNMLGVAAVAIAATWIVLRLWATWRGPIRRALPALTAGLIVLDLWHIAAPMVTVSAVDVPPQWAFMAQAVPATPDFRVMTVPNTITWQATAAYTRHLNASGYDPLISSAYQRLLDASEYDPLSPVMRLLGVRYFYTDRPFEWARGGERALLEGRVTLVRAISGEQVYELTGERPRAFVASQIRVVPDDAAALAELRRRVDPNVVILSQTVDCPASGAAGRARIASYAPNHVVIEVESGGGVLVLSDAYDPSWAAAVDGQPAELLRVYTALRGVCLPPGEHHVTFTYRPLAFYIGVALSLVTWLALCIFFALRALVQFLRNSYL